MGRSWSRVPPVSVLQALWTRDSTAVVYPCHAVIVTLLLKTGEQRFFLGHTDKVSVTPASPDGSAVLAAWCQLCWDPLSRCFPQVSVLAFSGSSTLLASAQAGPRGVGRLWDFPTGTCLCLFKTYLQSLVALRWVSVGAGVRSALRHRSFSVLFPRYKPGVNYSCLCLSVRPAGSWPGYAASSLLSLSLQVLLSPYPHNLSPFMLCGDELGVQGADFHWVSLLAAFPTAELFCVVSGRTCTAKR